MKTKINYLLLWLFITFFLNGNLQAQISFTNQSQLLPSNNHSGVAIGVNDMNGDDLDDIIRLGEGQELRIVYQDSTNNIYTEDTIGVIGSESQWSLCVADADGNGYGDVFTGEESSERVSMAENDGSGFVTTNLPGSFFAQGANFTDIDNDGFLDLFVCNDIGESYIYGNDQNAGFFEANDWIDMSFDGDSGEPASGNYSSVWTDFDNDGDTDLYIAKCRQGVNDFTDQRVINKLFVRDENNEFAEMGEEFGLDINDQSWSAAFQDIDNDGDMDCFVINHGSPSLLLENDCTGHFTDITEGSGITIGGQLPLQCSLLDFDNDGFVDLLSSGSLQYLYHNNGDKTFSLVDSIAENVFNDNKMHSYAIGDLNNDGFLDVYAGYGTNFTEPSSIDDVLWINNGNANNWFKAHLVGNISNHDGVGARIEIYGDWGIQIREVRAGESYGISNSLIQNFGLGTDSTIYHLVVKWPSGVVDLIVDPPINGLTEIVEGTCFRDSTIITMQGETTFCTGDSLVLTAEEGAAYYWSTGENTQEIVVTESGLYSLVIEKNNGCFGLSELIKVVVDPIEVPTIEVEGELLFCENESIVLNASPALAYDWSTGESSTSIEVTESGNYSVITLGLCDEFTSQELNTEVFPVAPMATANELEIEVETIGDPAALMANGANIFWYTEASGGELLGSGPTYIIPNVTQADTFYAESAFTDIQYMEPQDFEGASEYSPNQSGEIHFDALTDFRLKSVVVYTDTPGFREIELKNSDGVILQKKIVNLLEGERPIPLDFLIYEGEGLRLTTNTLNNLNVFGTLGPRLRRSNLNVTYPYSLDNIASITGSNHGNGRYFYFYNWEVQTPAVNCVEERIAFYISIKTPTIEITENEFINALPNPNNGLFKIVSELQSKESLLSIVDGQGRLVFQEDLGPLDDTFKEVDASHLMPGLYILQIQTLENRYFTKLLIH